MNITKFEKLANAPTWASDALEAHQAFASKNPLRYFIVQRPNGLWECLYNEGPLLEVIRVPSTYLSAKLVQARKRLREALQGEK